MISIYPANDPCNPIPGDEVIGRSVYLGVFRPYDRIVPGAKLQWSGTVAEYLFESFESDVPQERYGDWALLSMTEPPTCRPCRPKVIEVTKWFLTLIAISGQGIIYFTDSCWAELYRIYRHAEPNELPRREFLPEGMRPTVGE